MPLNSAIKRIINKDIKEIQSLDLNKLGIYIEFNPDNMLEAKALIIGPKDTPYENGLFYFKIDFPTDYPFKPPNVLYLSKSRTRIHPNLYVGRSRDNYYGKVCLSIINTWTGPKWTSVMHISSILLSIQSLLSCDPLHYEPGFEQENGKLNDDYNEIVKYDTFKNLIYYNYFNILPEYECFKQTIEDHIKNNIKEIISKIEENIIKYEKPIYKNVNVYNLNYLINYPELLNLFKQKFD